MKHSVVVLTLPFCSHNCHYWQRCCCCWRWYWWYRWGKSDELPKPWWHGAPRTGENVSVYFHCKKCFFASCTCISHLTCMIYAHFSDVSVLMECNRLSTQTCICSSFSILTIIKIHKVLVLPCNTNANSSDNVYDAVIIVRPLWEFIRMNAE